MSYLDDYVARISNIGLTSSDYYKNIQQDIVNNGFEDAPTLVDGLLNGISLSFRVCSYFNSKSLSINPDMYQKVIFKDILQVVDIGDIFEFNNSKWICTGTDTSPLSNSCYIQKSTSTLKFYPSTSNQSSDLSGLIEIPAIIGKGNIGLDTNKFMSLPADENIVQCANTVDSLKITENTRFILSGDAFIVLGIDKISNPGLLNIRIKENQKNDDDNLDLGIANYYSNQHVYEISILNNYYSSLNKDGDQLQIKVECKKDGIIVINPINITYSSSDLTVCTVSNSGLVTTLGKTGLSTITTNYNNISASISINVVSIAVNNYSCSVIGNDLKYGMQNTYNVVFANSGNQFGINATWELKDDDGISSTGLASIVSTNGLYSENCVIKSNLTNISDIGKYVRLYASSASPSISNYKRIKIISLI